MTSRRFTRPTARECFARGLAAYGLQPSRKIMTPTHQLELIERYPGLYRMSDDEPTLSARAFSREGFAVGDGWFDIIDRLSAKLSADPNLVVVQLKEKMALLTVYLDVDEEPARPSRLMIRRTHLKGKLALLSAHLSPILTRGLEAAMVAARKESSRTCEICGAPGVLIDNGRGWLCVRCDPCEWLDEMEEACRRLEYGAKDTDLKTFAADPIRLDASRRHVQHLGEAAKHQPPERRARLPGILWERLDAVRPVRAVKAMGARELWAFIRRQVPAIARALR